MGGGELQGSGDMTDLPDDEPQPGSRAWMEQTAQLDSAMATARRYLSALNAQDHPACNAPGWTASRLHRPSTRSLTGTAGVKVSMPPGPATPGPTPTTSGERPTPDNVHRGSLCRSAHRPDYADDRGEAAGGGGHPLCAAASPVAFAGGSSGFGSAEPLPASGVVVASYAVGGSAIHTLTQMANGLCCNRYPRRAGCRRTSSPV